MKLALWSQTAFGWPDNEKLYKENYEPLKNKKLILSTKKKPWKIKLMLWKKVYSKRKLEWELISKPKNTNPWINFFNNLLLFLQNFFRIWQQQETTWGWQESNWRSGSWTRHSQQEFTQSCRCHTETTQSGPIAWTSEKEFRARNSGKLYFFHAIF